MNFLLYLRWSVSPEILHFGNISVRWYGLLFALTFIVGYEILAYIFRKENVDVKKLDVLTIYIVLGTVIGARLGHCLFYSPSYYLSNPIEIIKIWEGGLASHGGAIGIIFAIWLFVRRNRSFSMLWILDRLVIVVALGGLFIRTGNFFNSEIYGLPSTAPWAYQ
ncbi:MAG: prolipoprotein diacylglyceryl transferase, partial [Bacteroidetes bacterium]|nr:prolipoprotein diacylglyceryl transferase [Bacteroidota bacterium]